MSEKGMEHLTNAVESLNRVTESTGDDLLVLRLAVQALLEENPAALERYRKELTAFIDLRLEKDRVPHVEERAVQMFPRLR